MSIVKFYSKCLSTSMFIFLLQFQDFSPRGACLLLALQDLLLPQRALACLQVRPAPAAQLFPQPYKPLNYMKPVSSLIV